MYNWSHCGENFTSEVHNGQVDLKHIYLKKSEFTYLKIKYKLNPWAKYDFYTMLHTKYMVQWSVFSKWHCITSEEYEKL